MSKRAMDSSVVVAPGSVAAGVVAGEAIADAVELEEDWRNQSEAERERRYDSDISGQAIIGPYSPISHIVALMHTCMSAD
jgi:hypothetical protein